jgi:hypothetical protein
VKLYVIGSLRNPRVPEFANELRALGHEVFDDWFASGPEADDKWREYEQARQRGFFDALQGEAARNTFEFDFRHLNEADAVVLLLPAGKSGHMELGWAIGKGKPGYIVCEEYPDRWDVMYCLATRCFAGEISFLNFMRARSVPRGAY